MGHHTTSDDSTKYRPANEIEWWRVARDPVARFRKWIERNGWWNNRAESELVNNLRQQVRYTFLSPLVDTGFHTNISLSLTNSYAKVKQLSTVTASAIYKLGKGREYHH